MATSEPDSAELRWQQLSRRFVGMLILLGILIRGWDYLACPSYWSDEAWLLLNVLEKDYGELLGPLDRGQVAPPAFLWTLRVLVDVLGPTEWAMRLPALLASLVALLLMVPLARLLVGPAGSWPGVALLAMSFHALMHADEVKPYAGDLLATIGIMLPAAMLAQPVRCGGSQWPCWLGLTVAALLGPWCSFPSVFSVGAAGLCLLTVAWQRWDRLLALGALTVSGLGLLSFATLWFMTARHSYAPDLVTFWNQHFLDNTSLGATLAWIGHTLIKLGDYATTGMGVPLLFLGSFGLTVIGRRSGACVVLLIGPVVLGILAAALGYYPLGDRLGFYAAPCMWLAAAAGLSALQLRLPTRWCPAGGLLLLLVLVQDGTRIGDRLLTGNNHGQFREAFQFVRQQRRPGEKLWVQYPALFELYFGTDETVIPWNSSAEVVQKVVVRDGLWVIADPPPGGLTYFPETAEGLQRSGVAPLHCRSFYGTRVWYYPTTAAAERR